MYYPPHVPNTPQQSQRQSILQNRHIQFFSQNLRYILWFLLYYVLGVFVYAPNIHRNLIIASIVYALICVIAITIALLFGDTIIKIIEGIRPLETKQEIEYLNPLFEAVCYDVAHTFENMPKIELCIVDSLSVNALAFGSHTIAVTQGAINTFSQDELKAVLAHEMAHIYYGHTKASMLNMLGNGAFAFQIAIVRWFSRTLDSLQSRYVHQKGEFWILLLAFLCKLWNLAIDIFLFLGNLILSGNNRENEFIADKFAYQAGYGRELTQVLYLLHKMSLGDNRRLIQRMTASHPRTSKRIQQLEWLEEQEYM